MIATKMKKYMIQRQSIILKIYVINFLVHICYHIHDEFKVQKQPPVVFFKQNFLKNFAIFTGKHLCWSLFLINLQASRIATLLKKGLQHRNFPVNIVTFKKTYFKKHLQTAASDSSYLLHSKLNIIIQELDWPFVSFET